MEQFLSWLASSPLASFAKIFGAGVLGWVVANLDTLSVHPAVAIGLASALPVLVNWLNPVDARYGDVGEEE
jgi:hypothetical protein